MCPQRASVWPIIFCCMTGLNRNAFHPGQCLQLDGILQFSVVTASPTLRGPWQRVEPWASGQRLVVAGSWHGEWTRARLYSFQGLDSTGGRAGDGGGREGEAREGGERAHATLLHPPSRPYLLSGPSPLRPPCLRLWGLPPPPPHSPGPPSGVTVFQAGAHPLTSLRPSLRILILKLCKILPPTCIY